jgi:hypothetical protein
MFETEPFSYDSIYKQVQNFCELKGMTQKSFRLNKPPLVESCEIMDYETLVTCDAFIPGTRHGLFLSFNDYLKETYSFKSKLVEVIESYDKFFNAKNEDVCYSMNEFYVITKYQELKKINVFQFNELQFGDYEMTLLEIDETDTDIYESKLLDYYLKYFWNGDFPEELRKPFKDLSAHELDLMRMMSI